MNARSSFPSAFLLIAAATALPAMANERLPATELLWTRGAPGALGDEPKDKPALIIYLANRTADDTKAATPNAAVLVLPGGGYGNLAMGHEGHEIARWFNSLGISAFIVDYRHRGKGYGHPAPMLDAQRAIRTVRARAEEFGVDPQRIGVIGFSAGGHLASTVATHFDAGDSDAADLISRASCRPDFAILCYPVIVFDQDATHRGSQRNLLGSDADPALIASLSNEKQVTPETPPTFLFHTNEDKGVPAENSVAFYLALRKHGVPAELHIFEKGRHGVGLATGMPGLSTWPDRCADWLRGRGILAPAANQTDRVGTKSRGAPFRHVECPGTYRQHLQGICTNGSDAIYWCFTSALVKTNVDGKLLAEIAVRDHHGDLCFYNGRIFVAVNFGDFNNPDGQADSWVYVYDAADLKFVAKHAVPEVIYGAGGITCSGGRYYVVGGLPTKIEENDVFVYDQDFKFLGRQTIPSGHTHLGIQTAAFANGSFWFGCYGGELLKTDDQFKLLGKYRFDCALGIVPTAEKSFLVANGACSGTSGCTGEASLADVDEAKGLVIRSRGRE